MRRRTIFKKGNPLSKTGVYVMHSDGSIEKVTVSGNPNTKTNTYSALYKTNNGWLGGCTATNVSTTDIGIIVVDTDLDSVFMIGKEVFVESKGWFHTTTYSGNQTGQTQLNTDLHVYSAESQTHVYDTISDSQRTIARNHHKSGATGVANTEAIKNAASAAGGSVVNCAAYYCYYREKLLPNGKRARGYLPSVAEMMVINDNIYAINAGLTALGGKPFNSYQSSWISKTSNVFSSDYWTSTEYDDNKAYIWSWYVSTSFSSYKQPIISAYNKNYGATSDSNSNKRYGVKVCYDLKGLI